MRARQDRIPHRPSRGIASRPRTCSTSHRDCSHTEPHQSAEAARTRLSTSIWRTSRRLPEPRAERIAELLDAPRRPREHEVGDVDACDEKHEPDGDEQEMQWAARGRHQILLQRNRVNGASARRGQRSFIDRLRLDSSARACSRLIPFRRRPMTLSALFSGSRVARESVRDPRVHVAGDRILEALRRQSLRPREARRSAEWWIRRAKDRRQSPNATCRRSARHGVFPSSSPRSNPGPRNEPVGAHRSSRSLRAVRGDAERCPSLTRSRPVSR